MGLTITTEPLLEPVTRDELKAHLRLDTTDDALSLSQSIAPGAHVVAAAYSLKGSGVLVNTSAATVYLNAGTNGAGATVDVKLQESNTDIDGNYTDVDGGAFTQVTTDNDNTTHELAYTGGYVYIRAMATVAVDTCDFAVSIALQAVTTDENDLLDGLITAARKWMELECGRTFIDTVLKLTMDAFPTEIRLPRPPALTAAIAASGIKYRDTDGTLQDLGATVYATDYESEPARVVEAYGQSWPDTREMVNAVEVTYTAGYGAAASKVPADIKLAIKQLAGHMYEHREVVSETKLSEVPLSVRSIVWHNAIKEFV